MIYKVVHIRDALHPLVKINSIETLASHDSHSSELAIGIVKGELISKDEPLSQPPGLFMLEFTRTDYLTVVSLLSGIGYLAL